MNVYTVVESADPEFGRREEIEEVSARAAAAAFGRLVKSEKPIMVDVSLGDRRCRFWVEPKVITFYTANTLREVR